MSNKIIFSNSGSHRIFNCVASILFLCGSLNINAQPIALQAPSDKGVKLEEKDLAARKQLTTILNKAQKSSETQDKIIQFGQERTILCNVCHGEDGNARRAGVPNLAGQNPVYLLDQIHRFSDGRRYDRTMASLASTFNEEEKVMLALYYSKMKARPNKIQDPEQWDAGKKVYDIACAQCHGENGRGEKGYARLASQKADYVLKMLNEYQSYTGRRANPWMSAVASSLNKEEIAAVAAYVSTLK